MVDFCDLSLRFSDFFLHAFPFAARIPADARQIGGKPMESQSTIEEDLEEALRTKEFKIFMEFLMDGCGEILKRRIKHHSCGFLTIDEMREVYQNAMIEVDRKVRDSAFNPHRPMAFVNEVVRLRTLDARRLKSRQKVATNTDDLLSAMAEADKSAGVVSRWRELTEDDQNRFMAELRAIISEVLPEGQRVVAQAYFDNLVQVAEGGWSVLVEPINAATGRRPTVSTIRSQWRNAHQTIADELIRRGFGFLKGE